MLAAAFLADAVKTTAQPVPWTEKQLKEPQALAKTLQDPTATKPAVFNIGPLDDIKGAVHIGPASKNDNLENLKAKLEKLPRDQEVVIYCGCCPFSRCPNVRPAFELLKELKFKNPEVLNTPVSLDEDWISKGYPMK
jgi:hypothetical protein